MNKYIISVRNTANGKYENVEVTEEVYRAYMRTGWNIKDNDESFFKHQTQFSALLGNIDDAVEKDCRRGKIDRIIVKSISRFARNTKDCLSVLRELKDLGITVLFESQNIDTANITDEIMVTVMGGLAQEESASISNNVRWG